MTASHTPTSAGVGLRGSVDGSCGAFPEPVTVGPLAAFDLPSRANRGGYAQTEQLSSSLDEPRRAAPTCRPGRLRPSNRRSEFRIEARLIARVREYHSPSAKQSASPKPIDGSLSGHNPAEASPHLPGGRPPPCKRLCHRQACRGPGRRPAVQRRCPVLWQRATDVRTSRRCRRPRSRDDAGLPQHLRRNSHLFEGSGCDAFSFSPRLRMLDEPSPKHVRSSERRKIVPDSTLCRVGGHDEQGTSSMPLT
jgi:hypothetical protein